MEKGSFGGKNENQELSMTKEAIERSYITGKCMKDRVKEENENQKKMGGRSSYSWRLKLYTYTNDRNILLTMCTLPARNGTVIFRVDVQRRHFQSMENCKNKEQKTVIYKEFLPHMQH